MIERICSWLCDWDTKLLIARHQAYQHGYEKGFATGRRHASMDEARLRLRARYTEAAKEKHDD